MNHDPALQPLNQEKIEENLEALSGWELDDYKICKTFEFPTFGDGVGFVSTLAPSLNEINHHPDIAIQYRKITFCLTSHDIGDKLSGRDFQVATIIDGLYGK